mmetsp:Transcript_91669/g.163155  ORF Transcript_91669/g.163155 Transcript_91669/m.163155 type:complete len:100 (+) Transcript_91669:38-337(+)
MKQWHCGCGWTSRGSDEDMLGHLRGKHGVYVRLSTSSPTERRAKFMPHTASEDVGTENAGGFAQCNSCGGQCFNDKRALLEHLHAVHEVEIQQQDKKKR